MQERSQHRPFLAGAIGGLTTLTLCASSVLARQSSEQRRALDAYRDTLQAVTDSTQLRGDEARLLGTVSRSRRDPMFHLRLGHLALRQGDLGGLSHYDDAASEFKWSTELAPQWPYAWYGLGLAEYALGSGGIASRDRRPPMARDAWARATLAFARAAALEPGFAGRLEEMSREALRDRAPDRAAVVKNALRRAAGEARAAHGARLLLALGRVERDLGDSNAVATFREYLAAGDDRALAQVELGRTLLLRGDLGGAETYLAGAADDSPGAVTEYRSDILPLATDAELADFDLRRGAARADMLRRFWSKRDRLELRRDGERLAEHLRRLEVARREFLLVDAQGVERLDDRGRVFIRHGEPDDRASFGIAGVEPNESWRYRRGQTDVVLHFAARQAPNEYRLVESLLDVSDVRTSFGPPGAGFGGVGPDASAEQLLRSRSALAPFYRQRPAGGGDRAEFLARERALGRRGIQIGTRSDSYPLRFAKELQAWGELAVAGGSGSEPQVQVLFAIPGYAIEPATGVPGVVYPVRIRFVALDTAGTMVASLDTVTRIELPDRVPANRNLVGRVAVSVRPGRLVAQAAVQYGELGGTVLGVDTLTVAAPGSGDFTLGDLLIGTRRSRLLMPFGPGAPLALAPAGLVRRSDGVELAAEVFGLPPGGEAGMEVQVAPMENPDAPGSLPLKWRRFPDQRAVSSVQRDPAGDAVARWRVMLPLGKLKPGSWWVAVVATDLPGRKVRREGRLEVVVP